MSVFTLPYQKLAPLLGKQIAIPNGEQLLQPASIDLPIGTKAYILSSTFIPYPGDLISSLTKNKMIEAPLNISKGITITPTRYYLFELDVQLELDFFNWGVFHTRSTAGRNDLFVAVIGNHQPLFNEVSRGYHGKLWMLVYSHSFCITVLPGDCLAQMRLQTEYDSYPSRPNEPIDYLIRMSALPDKDGIIAWWAKRNAAPFSWRDRNLDKHAYFISIDQIEKDQLVLYPQMFTILRSARHFSVPKDQALTIDTYVGGIGEFRSHYAGFIDPGFGLTRASSIVFEARSPYMLTVNHEQIFARAHVEYLTEPTDYPYDGTYTGQDLRLAKQFS